MSTPSRRSRLRELLLAPLDDVTAALDRLSESRSPARAMLLMTVGVVIGWFLYVPVHELLHVAGCLATGGSVTRLELDPAYGATLLARIFPFVEPTHGDYAGRLSGFDTGGSDLVYLATDFAPFLLTILVGVPVLRGCTRRARPVLLGMAAVVGLAPFYNLIGDYYEMGSIPTTAAFATASGGAESPYLALRSDDLPKLVESLLRSPGELGFADTAGRLGAALCVAVGTALGLLLGFATYAAGSALAGRWVGPRRPPAPR